MPYYLWIIARIYNAFVRLLCNMWSFGGITKSDKHANARHFGSMLKNTGIILSMLPCMGSSSWSEIPPLYGAKSYNNKNNNRQCKQIKNYGDPLKKINKILDKMSRIAFFSLQFWRHVLVMSYKAHWCHPNKYDERKPCRTNGLLLFCCLSPSSLWK